MRYLLILGLLALPLCALADTASDEGAVAISILAFGTVDLEEPIVSGDFTAGERDPEYVGAADVTKNVTVASNDEAWTLAIAIDDTAGAGGVANQVKQVADANDTMPAAVALSAGMDAGTNPGEAGTYTVTVTRDGLNDANGDYSGEVTATLTYN